MTFIDICELDQKKLKAALVNKLNKMNYKPIVQDGFIYAEGEVPVLLVAHMDTVHHDNCTIICTSENGDVVMSPQGIGGDDRCGIFMILETIKELKCSVLFTEDEEKGCIGAGKFVKSGIKPTVALNYIIEYDRKGADDAVFYDCDNTEFEAFVTDKEIGFKTAFGSCSDICDIAPYLDLAAVNLSCGYYNQHTQHEYVKMSEMMRNIERGKQLIRKPSGKFIWIEAEPVYKYSYGKGSYGYGAYGGYGKYGYGSTKKDDDYWDSIDYSDIYDNIEEVAIQLYEESFVKTVKTKELVPVMELCDYWVDDFVVTTEEGEKEISDYCNPNFLYMDKDDCSLFILDTDNMWEIPIATETGDYIKRKDGKQIMYHPDTMETMYLMTPAELADFTDYVDNYLDYDIERAKMLGTI